MICIAIFFCVKFLLDTVRHALLTPPTLVLRFIPGSLFCFYIFLCPMAARYEFRQGMELFFIFHSISAVPPSPGGACVALVAMPHCHIQPIYPTLSRGS